MAKKFYVVWKGRETGIFTDWNTCKGHIDKFAGAQYKSFKTQAEAEAAFNGEENSSLSNGEPATGSSPKMKPSVQSPKTYTAVEIDNMAIETKIFTDGGCVPNPGKAGSGIAVYRDNSINELWYGLYQADGTNNTAELNALHQALIMAKHELQKDNSVAIFCDSKYSIQCITQWAAGWEKKGWVKKTGEIKNLNLIKEMYALHQLIKNKIEIFHVNGHVGVEGNELADRMSMLAIQNQEVNLTQYNNKIDVHTILAMSAG